MTDHRQKNGDAPFEDDEGSNARFRRGRDGLREHMREMAKQVLSDKPDDVSEDSPRADANLYTPSSEVTYHYCRPDPVDPPVAVKSLWRDFNLQNLSDIPSPGRTLGTDLTIYPETGGMAFPGPSQELKQTRRDRQVADVVSMLQGQFYLTQNESRNSLLTDKDTGETLPYTDQKILERVKVSYWRASAGRQQDISFGVIKSAISIFINSSYPTQNLPFYGRAGVDSYTGKRYLATGNNCLVFFPGLPTYQRWVDIPHVLPRESLPIIVPENIGNTHPLIVNTLFDITLLPTGSDLLVIAWMVMVWRSDSSSVMLELLGEPTPGLAETQQILKRVLDPASCLLEREVPKTLKQLDIRAQCHYLLSFHQVDKLSDTQQKGLLTLMQGKVVEWRTKDKRTGVDINVRCPVMLNSVESVATYAPLADSTLSIEICSGESGSTHGRPELAPNMAEATIFHGLLRVFGHVNQFWSHVENDRQFDRYGGLRDLCRIGVLVAGALGRETDEFWQQFRANQQSRRDYELEENPIAMAVKSVIDESDDGQIEATVKDWLALLDGYRPEPDPSGAWPATSRGLAAKFKQSRALLETFGIQLVPLEKRGPYGRWRASCDASRQQ
ncbi:hypothetical protein [Halomonas sp. 25-S5]|uniref:hypothetical protein n=1 Tax=Halomonas sp. 25-S5 TaxID=2994065 RepID=UPI0024688C8A|nr:hypothetical protein [Halomonas sp. 25-S5]